MLRKVANPISQRVRGKYMNNISFIIPCYNCESTLMEAVNSITNNNFEEGDEIILVNDGSNDNTLTLIHALANKQKHIKVINLDSNQGSVNARNVGVKNAENELIFNLDSDNILLASSIINLRNLMDKYDIDACSFRNLFYFRHKVRKVEHIWRFIPGIVEKADCLAGGINPISSGNYLFKKSVWQRIGGYKEGTHALDAWFFGFETVFNNYKLYVSETSGYFHRFGHNSLWMRNAKLNVISQISRKFVLTYKEQLSEKSIRYLNDLQKSKRWFEEMDKNQIKIKDESSGKTGTIISKSLYRYNTAEIPFL